jgi:hypothetical protein
MRMKRRVRASDGDCGREGERGDRALPFAVRPGRPAARMGAIRLAHASDGVRGWLCILPLMTLPFVRWEESAR